MTNSKDKLTEREVRIEKIKEMRTMGVNPYAQSFDKQQMIEELKVKGEKVESEKADELLKKWADNIYTTAGRMMTFRSHGKLSFAKLRDATGDIQICFVRDLVKLDIWNNNVIDTLWNDYDISKEWTQTRDNNATPITIYKFIQKYIDMGDFIGVRWDLFVTKHWELTLFVNEVKFLSKAIRPLPEKFHGLKDQEAKYRQRYLDLTANEESYQRFRQRSVFMKIIRDFYDNNKFMEVETSVLWNAASGAAAQPFITHHNDFDIDMFLRISPETALKKLTAWRFERIFEVAKDFRNEWSDPSHIQEFTMIEHYAAYWNFEDNMKFTEQMFDYIFDKMPSLNKKIMVKDKAGVEKEVDFTTPWKRVDYIDQIKKDSEIDVSKYKPEDEEQLRSDIKAKWHKREWLDIQTTATMIDYLYKKVTRPQIVGPAFIYNYPKTMQPLARVSDADDNIVEQRQLLINGWEIIKAYSELVDPLLQQANFDEQADALVKWDEEATSGDDEFVTAMEHGMPCQSGWGMWIDRIFSLLTKQENIRDVVLFPLMKPEVDNTKKESDKLTGTFSFHSKSDSSCEKTSKEGFSDWKKLFIFDFDWVVANSTKYYFKINKEKIWNTKNFDDYKDLFMGNIFQKLQWEKSNQDAKVELEMYFEEQEKIVDEVTLFDWIIDVLKELKNKWIILDIVSSNRREFIKQILKKNNLEDMFMNIYSEEDHFSKVDKIQDCLKKQNIGIENSIFVTDTLWDVLEANKVWIDTIAVDYWLHEKWRLEKWNPKYIVSSPEKILTCIFEQKTGFLPSQEWQTSSNELKKTPKKEFLSLEIVQQAEKLAEKYLTDTHNHCKQVGQIMKFFANKLWEDENLRYVSWLLHDIDWNHIGKNGNKHLWEEFNNIMEELKWSFDNESEFEQLKNDLRSHAHFLTGVQPETTCAKYLCAVDELSGLIHAYSLMRPTGMEWLKAKSIKKKIKDKSFAAGVDRIEVKNCEKFLWLNLDEFITDVIEGM